MAEAAKGSVDKLLSDLAGHLGPEGARRDGNVVTIAYPTWPAPDHS